MMQRYSRLAPDPDFVTKSGETTYRFVFSNEKVGRDGHVVLNKGIKYANYLRNNIVLWCHDDTQPPIGRGSNIDTSSGTNCRVDVSFIPRETLPFAGTVLDLVNSGYISAVSMSWQPLKWSYSTDNARPGGIDFKEVDLLEISIVPLPALPGALLAARSRGLDTTPMAHWAERALDTRVYRNLERTQLEAIHRAACGSSTRSARAHDLLQISDKDRKVYERYAQLRDGYGFTTDQAAWDIGIDAVTLRKIVARMLQRGPQ